MSEPLTNDLINSTIASAFPGSPNSCFEIGDDWAVATIVPDVDALRPGGFISGPTQFALADSALYYLSFVALGRVELMTLTSELSIRYLRPAAGEVLWAKASLDSAGRRNMVGTVKLWVDDREAKPTAVAQGTYVFPSS